MNYNWEGDQIIQESSIAKKRFVIGRERVPITTDIREFVSPQDDAVIKNILRKLVKEKGLPVSKNPGDFDKRAMIIWDHVARDIRYRYDNKSQGKSDFWLFPSEVHTLKTGDCEDGAFLLASLLIGSGISPFNVRVALGELFDGRGRSRGGHCWPVYKNEAGIWCTLESTLDRAPWSMPPAETFTDTGHVNYVPYFCFNNYHLWAIYHDRAKYGKVEEYLRKRGGLANLRDPRFPSGGWIASVTGDNSPGHYELTREVLKEFGFSDDAASIASDAAQDPDLYEWDNHNAHAQTKNDDEGWPDGAESSHTGYLDWVDGKIGGLYSFAQGSPEDGLFFLGYALHGVQDLAAHQGVTNAQHSYESFISPGKDLDRDHLEVNRVAGKAYTRRFLERLNAKRPALFNKLKTHEADFSLLGPKVSKARKCELLEKPGWDFSVPSYLKYKSLAEKFKKIKDRCPGTVWEDSKREWVFNSILGLIR